MSRRTQPCRSCPGRTRHDDRRCSSCRNDPLAWLGAMHIAARRAADGLRRITEAFARPLDLAGMNLRRLERLARSMNHVQVAAPRRTGHSALLAEVAEARRLTVKMDIRTPEDKLLGWTADDIRRTGLRHPDARPTGALR